MRRPDNQRTYVRKTIVPVTFGTLREQGRGFTVICRKCAHQAFLDPKAMRYLGQRLPDGLKLDDAAEEMFRCSECFYDRVRLSPEPMYSGARFIKGGPLV